MALDRELADILERLELPSESHATLLERFAESISLARAGEGAIALENACDNLFDFGVGLRIDERDALAALCLRCGASPNRVKLLDRLVGPGPHPRVVATVGGPIDETRVTLSFHGDDLEPEEVSKLLGCQPSRSHRRGDVRPRDAKPWPHGAWLLTFEGKAPTDAELLLNRLLNTLPADPKLWSELRRRFTVRLGLGLFLDAWNRGFELSSETIARVSRTAGSLGFDIYCDAADDDDSAALRTDG